MTVRDPTSTPALPGGLPFDATQVQFTPAGAGAVARSVQDKLRDVVALADFSTSGNFDTAVAALSTTGKYALGGSLQIAAFPVLIGTLSLSASRAIQVGGTFTGSTEGQAFGVTTTLTPNVNASAIGIVSEPTFTKAASGSHSVFASMWARTPVIGGGAATIGTLATFYVQGVNTAGINNYTIFSEEGVNRFGTTPATDQSVFGSASAIANQTVTVAVNTNTTAAAPRGIFVSSTANNSGEVAGITFGFNGGQYSAGVTAIQTDTAQQSADLAFFTRTSAGGGATATRWRVTGGADPGHLKSDGAYNIQSGGSLYTSIPNTQTGATYTVLSTDSSIIANRAGTVTLTLETASTVPGKQLIVRTIQAQTVVSASSNVVPLVGGAAGTAILAATAGKWAMLHSDGSAWQVMMGN